MTVSCPLLLCLHPCRAVFPPLGLGCLLVLKWPIIVSPYPVKTLEPVVLEGSALEEETELELGDPELQCPLEQKNMMTVTDESGKKFYYKIVPKPQTFERAQVSTGRRVGGLMLHPHPPTHRFPGGAYMRPACWYMMPGLQRSLP